jgi:hypothetical protein
VPRCFAGLTPDAIGLAQFNMQVPSSLPSGSTSPLVINFNEVTSSPVNLAIGGNSSAKPDVSIQITDVQPQAPLATDNMWFAETITTSSKFSGNLLAKLYISQSSPVSAGSAQSSGNSSFTLSGTGSSFTYSHVPLPSGLQPGTYYVAVGLMLPSNTDPQDVVLSNALRIQVIAQRRPFDLSVQMEGVSPNSIGSGDPVSVHYAVTEASGMSRTFTSSVYISTTPAITANSTLVKTWTIDVVKGNLDITSAGNSVPRGLSPGGYYLGVIVQTNGDSTPMSLTRGGLTNLDDRDRVPYPNAYPIDAQRAEVKCSALNRPTEEQTIYARISGSSLVCPTRNAAQNKPEVSAPKVQNVAGRSRSAKRLAPVKEPPEFSVWTISVQNGIPAKLNSIPEGSRTPTRGSGAW